MFDKLKEMLKSQAEIEAGIKTGIETGIESGIKIYSPLSGRVLSIEEVNDPTFSEKMLGDGVAIYPDSTKVYSPVNGIIDLMFKTGHAVSIKSDEGAEILVHIGLNTIELKGENYKTFKQSGDPVKVGDLLIEFEGEEILKKGYDICTPVVICNLDDYKEVLKTTKKSISVGEELLTLIKK